MMVEIALVKMFCVQKLRSELKFLAMVLVSSGLLIKYSLFGGIRLAST